MTGRVVIVCVLLSGTVGQAHAQDSLQLGVLQSRAAQHDPRTREAELLALQSRLRQSNLNAERKPAITAESQAQYQSDVARIPITLPGNQSPPTPRHDTYDARLVAQQKIYDPTLTGRRALEDAQLAESRSRLRVTLFGIQRSVNDQYFAALHTQSEIAEVKTLLTDLSAQLRVAQARVNEGVALPSEEMTLRAELLRRRQSLSALEASRRATLDVLASLTGSALDSTSSFATPDLAESVSRVRANLDHARGRAEYEQFARARDVVARQEDARVAQDKPRVSAFGRLGYGRPGLNPLATKFDSYWLAGVQAQWTPFNWGTSSRDREVLSAQREIISAEEKQFTDELRRSMVLALATMDRLGATLSDDDEIVTLRERISAETRARFVEGVVTSAEYVDKQTDVLSARIARAGHRVELVQARAHFLTTVGIEVR